MRALTAPVLSTVMLINEHLRGETYVCVLGVICKRTRKIGSFILNSMFLIKWKGIWFIQKCVFPQISARTRNILIRFDRSRKAEHQPR